MKTTRKLLALVLCMCMVLSCVPVMQAAAAEAVSNEPFDIYNANSEPKGWSITSLDNSGLVEVGSDWAKNYSFGVVEEADGNKAIALNKDGMGYAALTTPAISVTPGSSYRLGYAYRNAYVGLVEGAESDTAFWGMIVSVHFYDADGAELTGTHKKINPSVLAGTVSEVWNEVTFDFTAVEGAASAKVLFGIGGQKNALAQMLIDDFSVDAYAASELPNGDFNGILLEKDGAREASVDGPGTWDVISANINGNTFNTSGYENKYLVSTVEENGDKVLELKPVNLVQGYAVAHSAYVKAEENATYVLKYDQKTTGYDVKDGAAYRGARVFLYFYDSNKAMLGYQEQSVKEIQDWTTKTLTATTPEGTAYLAIGLYIGGVWNSAGGFAYCYDDISLTKVDFNGDFEYIVSDAPYNWTKTSMTAGSAIETEYNWAANYTLAAAAGEGVNGSTAASLTKNSTGYAALTSIPVTAQGGKAYRVSYAYKTTSLENVTAASDFYGIHAVAECLDADGNTVTDGWILLNNTGTGKGQTVSADWETATHDLVAPEGTVSIRVYLGIGGLKDVVATVLFDDVTVSEYADNAIVNADFEGTVNEAVGGRNGATDGPSGWSVVSTDSGGNWPSIGTTNYLNNYAVTTLSLDNGDKVMKLVPCTTTTGTRGYIVAHSQPIAVEAATSYTLTFDQKVDVGDPTYDAKILFYYFDENMEFIAGDWKRSSGVEHDWQSISVSATTRAKTAYVIIGLYIGGAWDNNPGIAYYYDDLQLTKQPTTYTVSYVAGEETVDQYTVEKGGDVPANVKIPTQAGYIGSWDHDGTNITADTTITAVYTPKAELDSWNLVLGDDIGVCFYIKVVEGQESKTVVKLTVGENTTAWRMSSLTPIDGLYVIRGDMAAAQMTDVITLEVLADDAVLETKTCTVREYADYILDEANVYSDADKQLTLEMLNYGAAAQTYFAHNTENLATAGLDMTNVGTQQLPATAMTEMAVSGKVSGISYYGATLLFESKTAVRFYFKAADITGYTFKVGENVLTAQESSNGLYYVQIGDIVPQDLDEAIALSVTAGEEALTVSYGPMNYMVRKNANGSETLCALLKAMYNYYLAAEAYVA